MSRILIVEDDAALARGLVALLSHNGYDVESVGTAHGAIAHHAVGAFAGMILDLGLPDKSGFEVLRQIRALGSRCPVLILTARGTLDDRVMGLDQGADDYLPKPFEPPELLARLRAILRRSQGDPSPTVQVGALCWDRGNGTFRLGEEILELPRRERVVLEELVGRAGTIVLRERLTDVVFGLDDDVGRNALEVYIGRIRKKLSAGGPQIRTIRGLGYMLDRS
jgi:two-component system, OmpR family, response regulator TctD